MPGHGRRHRHEPLVVDLELGPEGAQDRARLGALLGGRLGRRVPDRHPAAEPGRRVRHAPHDPAMAEEPLERGGRGAGDDRQDELLVAEVGLELAPDPGEHLGLDREQDDIGPGDRLDVAGDGPDPVRPAELLAPLATGVAGDDLPGRDELAAEQAGDHRLGHHAGADRRDRPLREGGHGGSIRAVIAPAGRATSPVPGRPGPRVAAGSGLRAPRTKNRGVAVTSTARKPAARKAASSSSGR